MGNIFSQLIAQQCCTVASCTVIWCVLAPCCKLQQHVAWSRSGFYFVQHVAATCNRVEIRTILRCNLQHNIVAWQVARKCCPYYFTFTACEQTIYKQLFIGFINILLKYFQFGLDKQQPFCLQFNPHNWLHKQTLKYLPK